MRKEHHVIFIPGLKDQHPVNRTFSNLLPFYWNKFGVTTHVIFPHWEDGAGFNTKLKIILKEIDKLSYYGHAITIVGQSAGGSAAMNAFCERRNKIKKAVNITGRLKKGKNVSPDLDESAGKSRAFKESVLLFENTNEPSLSASDREKCLTIRPFWDETVPSITVSIKGVTNIVAPFPEHVLGGVLILFFYAPKILK